MTRNFSYNLVEGWLEAEKCHGRPWLEGLLPHQKLLLLSDGSLTLELELLAGARVTVEVTSTGKLALNGKDAEYLGEAAEEDSVEREVWLTAGGRRFVYAQSIIPLSHVHKGLLRELEEKNEEPLGRVLYNRKALFTKEKLEVAVLRCAPAARDLNLDPQTPMVARRYILLGMDGPGKSLIKAAITEVFSPELIPAPAERGA